MTPAAPWADLNGELLVSIAAADNGVSLRDYKCLRGVCAAWRSALNPPYPCVLSLADDGKDDWHWRSAWPSATVLSLPTQRSSLLQTASSSPLTDRLPSTCPGVGSSPMFIPSSDGSSPSRLVWRSPSTVYPGLARIIGSSSGRFAVAVDLDRNHNNTKSDAPYTTMRIFLLNTGAGKEVELDPPTAPYNYMSGSCHMYVHKVVFAPSPDDLTVVALYDLKNVAYIDITTGRPREWTTIDVLPSTSEYKLDDLAFDNDGKLYCLDSCGGAYMVSIPRGGRQYDQHVVVVEPIVCNPNNPLAAFAPPYDRASASALTDTKHLFFCNGGMYQMWRNKSVAVTLRDDTRFRMAADEIFVLRYNPQCWPCWEAVRDLGGCSVFIGKNNPVVVRPAAGGQPWVRPNCVYWIDWKRVPMVCDIATGTSNPCVLPDGACKGNCWYFDNDIQGHI